MIDKYNLSNNVILLGYQNNIGRLLNDCDIFVHPSYKEGFGIAVAEAMHAGKPIIVSCAGALPELIINQKNGLVVTPHNPEEWVQAILSLLNKSNYASELGKNAKVKAKEFYSFQNFVNSYNNFYEEILSR
jgi:glycosyltransferase involved in cell wall biosynthesis